LPSRLARNEEEINCDVSCELSRELFADVSYALETRFRSTAGAASSRGMTRCARCRVRPRERQLLNAGVLININHTGLSCCSSMLLAAATLGNSCPPNLAGPYNAAKFGLANVASWTADRLFEFGTCPAGLKRPVFLVPSFRERLLQRHFGKRRFLSGDSSGARPRRYGYLASAADTWD